MSSSVAAASTPAAAAHPLRPALLLGALGIVFGDIGTSPIYAFRESLKTAGDLGREATVLGVLSMVFWAIILIVALKYVVLVMRADNEGEGGTMALLSLALPVAGRLRGPLLVAGLAGASLFFGDAMITPAISVLSAIEGLRIAVPAVSPYVVPIAALVLVGLFAIQSRGSGKVGYLFGPVMAAWFGVLALAGIAHLVQNPRVLLALDPRYAVAYAGHAGGATSFVVLGSVFLALTGGEALYADMGHFGRTAIRINWFALVMPALVLNYLGQGALVLADPGAAENPFFLLFSGWLLIPAVLLTTAATIIASQAVLSGAFALVQQAIQLGVVPRLEVRQTSEESAGQVYVPQVNWLLAAVVMALVFGFRSSDALANAYGIAVAGDMLVTTLLVAVVAHGLWRWPAALVLPVAGAVLLLDLTFVSANLHKIPAGGWFPLLVGAVTLTLMLCWRKGRLVVLARRDENAMALKDFIAGLDRPQAPARMRGTAVYLTKQTDIVPAALALNVRHNGVVHERVVLLKVTTDRAPRMAEARRVRVEPLASGFHLVWIVFGFAEKPDVMAALRLHRDAVGVDPDEASFFIGRETPVPSVRPDLSRWEEILYAFMTRNAVSASDYFLIPPTRVVELGTRVEM
ncbi:Low affinity potassium transport system protein kup [Methylobacterium crusticola]|uniref:Probable potassium transport system protein Kup n=1 Tax=Methylobacterium crusticola TaxID=1697972 RepID=A0ABQ4R7Q5_9HYPH|nr:potassium transporter Kup [Methylobacterium crusticola]GJD52806.1 Low affinity potassium transport system protein kup [Methylobacterium crusticola]